MPPSEESMKIANAFSTFARTGDHSLVKDMPENKLEIALLQYSADKAYPHYAAMQSRLAELKEARRKKEEDSVREKKLAVAKEANEIAKKANLISWFAVALSAISLIASAFALWWK